MELPVPVKAEMGKLIAAVDVLELRGVRTVRAEGLHLTLRFLGDVDSDDRSKHYIRDGDCRSRIRTV